MSSKPVTLDREDARGRARYFFPERGYGRPLPPIKEHVFVAERDAAFAPDAKTGLIALDRSAAMEMAHPATTPAILANYLVVRAGERFDTLFVSSGEVYYVLQGAGTTTVGGETLTWKAGDAMALPGGCAATHAAQSDAVLVIYSDEPQYRFLGAAPSDAPAQVTPPTLFDGDDILSELTTIHTEADLTEANAKAIVLYTPPFERILHATPGLGVAVNSLDPGGDQKAHKHSAAALTLCIAGEGVHSMVWDKKIPWQPGAVMLTPPLAPHSHHNRGKELMRSFVVQDSGLHAQLRTSSFVLTE